MEVKPEIDTPAKIKVIGVGGGGGSAVNRMIRTKLRGVEFLVANTDEQALRHSQAGAKIQIGKSITKGLGAGMDPEMGRRAAEETQNEIRDALAGADMVFITCGLGGGTGTGASPIVAELARDIGALTVAIVTKPFTFELSTRKSIAERGWEELASKVDAIITIPNDKILQNVDKKTTTLEAFEMADEILQQGVRGISEMITTPGLVNVDFADVKTIMKNSGTAIMGIGRGSGDNRAVEGAKGAISSPLLDLSIEGAKGILFTVTGGPDLGILEINEAAKIITTSADPDAKVIFGTVIDETAGDEIRVTVIATGFTDRDKIVSKATFEKAYAERTSPYSTPSSYMQSSIQRPVISKQPVLKPKISVEPQQSSQIKEEDISDEDITPAFIRKKMM
ncbi:cell division protein FtsZ [Candidatus Uhrbacteria bacterium]|nr:cell division protein FtsZ [Candidatus Uhrbacteria bacterium]